MQVSQDEDLTFEDEGEHVPHLSKRAAAVHSDDARLGHVTIIGDNDEGLPLATPERQGRAKRQSPSSRFTDDEDSDGSYMSDGSGQGSGEGSGQIRLI